MMMPGVSSSYHSPYSVSSSAASPDLQMPMERSPRLEEEEPGDSPAANVSLAVPELIEMLKNLAACNEKQYKWEVSLAKLQAIPGTDPNRQQLMDIIEFVDRKSSTRDKAIYLYEQLGQKCHQHGNYIGAAKAFERAAGLRLDVTDQLGVNNADPETIRATIRCLESAILNYDAIHKYKHAGTLHYRCARILKMTEASRPEVELHHIKALEYFTKPDHELKQRKRIDGLKISCYSSCSTWARTTKRKMHLQVVGTSNQNRLTTTTTKMVTTSNHHMIKFRENHCTGGSEHRAILDSEDEDDGHFELPPATINSGVPAEPAPDSGRFQNAVAADEDYLEKYLESMEETDMPSLNMYLNDSMPSGPSTPSIETPKRRAGGRQSYSAHHHSKQKAEQQQQHKPMSRCIEDRIESARKLVKKLHKLCPFYEVSTTGNDAGRVYCRICDRYLGAVSSTLKNHVNTQEHRQALEDSQQPQPQQPMAVVHPASLIAANTEYHQQPAPSGQMMLATATLPLRPPPPAAPTWFSSHAESSEPSSNPPSQLPYCPSGSAIKMLPTSGQPFGSNSMVMMKSNNYGQPAPGHQGNNTVLAYH